MTFPDFLFDSLAKFLYTDFFTGEHQMSRTIKPRNPYAPAAFTKSGAGSHKASKKGERSRDKAELKKNRDWF
jgi:hypothetical protein